MYQHIVTFDGSVKRSNLAYLTKMFCGAEFGAVGGDGMRGFGEFEAQLVVDLNHALAAFPTLFILYDVISNNSIRGLPIFFAISFIWFQKRDDDQLKIILGIVGACIATIISVIIQRKTTFLFRMRPLIDPSLSIVTPNDRTFWYDYPNSFPSDTATMYSALCFIILLCRPYIGIFIFAWCVLIILLPRAILGYHYPTDIVAGTVLAFFVVFMCVRLKDVNILPKYNPTIVKHDAIFSSIFVIVILEMSDVFLQLRRFISTILKLSF